VPRIPRLRQKLAIYVAAGPSANLLTGLCVRLFFASHLSSNLPATLHRSLQIFAGLSILVPLINLIPLRRPDGMFTDGARLISLANSKLKTRRWICVLALQAQRHSGVRPRDLKQTWIAHACAIPDQSLDALHGFWNAYLAANDRKDPELAARALEKCLERLAIAPANFKNLLLREAAVFHAWFRDDGQKAKSWLQKSQSGPPAPFMVRLRLEICMHWAARRHEELLAAWERGRAHIEKLPPSPAAKRLQQSWLEWRNDIETKHSVRIVSSQPQAVSDASSSPGLLP